MNTDKWRNAQENWDYRAEPQWDEDAEDPDSEREELEQWFIQSVKSGRDVTVRLGSDRITSWVVSDYLGEPVKEDKPLLLKACSLAFGKDDAATAAALRAFVESVAKHHAEEECPS